VPKGAVLPRLLILFDSGGARFRGNVCREDLHSGQRYVVEALFTHLTGRWCDLLNVCFEVLLYDLTSTYFESDPPLDESDEHRHGYSRDHRLECAPPTRRAKTTI
jgi:hypothetical protein